MEKFQSLTQVAQKLKDSNKKVTLLYGFNGTGKTRLSMEFKNLLNETSEKNDEQIKRVIYYNAFTEDLFSWDNDLDNDIERKLKINTNSTFITLIENQGKENEIAEKFREFTSSKIEPSIDAKTGEITFSLPTGDEDTVDNIKISKGEESIFIWSFFHVLLETIISELNIDDDADRSTNEFDQIHYIFIDDPISSLDDNHAIDTAINLKELISKSENKKLKFIVSTHHALFYNVLHNDFQSANRYILNKDDTKYYLQSLGNHDSPFGYHLLLKKEIERAIVAKDVKKYHFNLLRNILEKTAYFLGYDKWSDLIEEEDKASYVRRINLYSHSDHSYLESKELEPQEQQFLIRIFEKFTQEYKWREE